MNKQLEKMIKYLGGDMSPDDKIQFEKNLLTDSELNKEFEKVKIFLTEMKKDAEPSLDESYFINILPVFYANQQKKKKFIFSKLAYSLSTVAAVILILFILFKPGTTVNYSNLSELSTTFTEQELDETLNQYTNQYSINDLINSASSKTDSIVSTMVDNELNLSSGSVEKSFGDSYINTDDLINSLDEKEANQLYSQLINEDFIKGAKQ